MFRATCAFFLFIGLSSAQQTAPAQAPAPGSPEDLVQQGQKLSREGKQDEALALYAQALKKSPDLYEAHLATGVALDLEGEYKQAHYAFVKAIDAAPPDSKQQAKRAMAISFVFDGDPNPAANLETDIYNARVAKSDWIAAAETCNELARIYLEAGDANDSYKWYKLGYNTALRKSDLTEADKNLWLFRWENAQARIAARRGQATEAQQHVAAAKAALDKANNPDQARFYPYLTGYVAFYTGDYKTAITELEKADQHDPFILVLLAQAYEKSGDLGLAKEYYRKVLAVNMHNPTNAFARPIAKKKLKEM